MKHRILIVEDNVMLAGQQKRWLEKSGYGVSTTIDEPGARKRIKSEHFDLVLADVRLPEGNGISLLEWLRKEKINIPFIVMTGYASVPDAVKAIKLGADDYLAKPVQMDEFLELIKDILQPSSRVYDRDRSLFRRNSPQMLEVENLARTVARLTYPCLFSGRTEPARNPSHSGYITPATARKNRWWPSTAPSFPRNWHRHSFSDT